MSDLTPIITEHRRLPSSHNRHDAALALDALSIDVDEGTHVTYHDASVLALTVTALAATIARMRGAMVDAEDAPPVSLADVLEAHACAECGEVPCMCWVDNPDAPAPVDVHPGERRAVAHAIHAARSRRAS